MNINFKSRDAVGRLGAGIGGSELTNEPRACKCSTRPPNATLGMRHSARSRYCQRPLVFFGIALVAFVLHGCTRERTLGPQLPRYTLFLTVANKGDISIDVIDLGLDSVVHRIPDAGTPASVAILANLDGSALVTFDIARQITVFDVATLSQISSIPTKCRAVSISSRPPRVFCHEEDSVLVYDLPSLDLDTVLRFSVESFVESTDKNELYGLQRTWDSAFGHFSHSFVRISGSTFELTDSFRLVSPATDRGIIVTGMELSASTEEVFLRGYDDHGRALYSFNVETRRCKFRLPIESLLGGMAVTPDGRYVWVTEGYPYMIEPPPQALGHVLVVDAATGVPVDTIHTRGLRIGDSNATLPLGGIGFHPMEDKAYVVSTGTRPALLVINVPDRTIKETLYEDIHTTAFFMAIAAR